MRNYFILDGVDSRDFGVYISGQGTFSAPQKAYTFYNIPGRNGALLGNEHRLENINVSYEAFIYTDFDNNMAKFRSFLLSLNGYKRLTDSYHPDEFRMAVYAGPFDPKVTRMNDAGSFTITFSCKPQRFLYSGDASYYWVPGGDQNISGSILSVYVPKIDTSEFKWKYSNHADPNKSTPTKPVAIPVIQSMAMKINGTTEYSPTFLNGGFAVNTTECELDLLTGTFKSYSRLRSILSVDSYDSSTHLFSVSFGTGFTVASCNYYPLRSSYANVLLGAYGCYYDTSTGILYIKDTRMQSKAEMNTWISNDHTIVLDAVYTTAQITVSLTPYTFNLPSEDIVTISGDYGESEEFIMKYSDSDSMSNPTPFPSEPLIRAYGNGSFTMDGITITITNATSYTDIDCEAMDCYEGSTNRNNDVSFSTYDFPKLQPGDNSVNIVSGITAVQIQPRWWRV